MQVLHRPSELAAQTGQVEMSKNHMSGNPTYQELSMSPISSWLQYFSRPTSGRTLLRYPESYAEKEQEK